MARPAPADSRLKVTVESQSVLCDGKTKAVVRVEASDPSGKPLRDEIAVRLSSPKARISEEKKLHKGSVTFKFTPRKPTGKTASTSPLRLAMRRPFIFLKATLAQEARDMAQSLIFALLLVMLVIRPFITQVFYIPSSSMEPTLFIGDRLLAGMFTYRFTDPKRGDVVIFKAPNTEEKHRVPLGVRTLEYSTYKDYIKRVIAIGGDTLEVHDGHTYLNGKVQDEPYTKEPRHIISAVQSPEGPIFPDGRQQEQQLRQPLLGPARKRRRSSQKHGSSSGPCRESDRFSPHQYGNRRPIFGKSADRNIDMPSTLHRIHCADARDMAEIPDGSVHLVVTSPPYWQLKDYGNDGQIGFNDSYEEYVNNLNLVWSESIRALHTGCRLCINAGDQFARSVYYGRYKAFRSTRRSSNSARLPATDYMGRSSGARSQLQHNGRRKHYGSFPYPRNGILKLDYEYIMIFKKPGDAPEADDAMKESARMSTEEWNTLFAGHWNFIGERQNRHLAPFPEGTARPPHPDVLVPRRNRPRPLPRKRHNIGRIHKTRRNSIGYEINPEYAETARRRILSEKGLFDPDTSIEFATRETNEADLPARIAALPIASRR